MRILFKLLILGSLLLPIFSYPISRIGGGKVNSNLSLFQAELSLFYQKVQTGNEVIHLYSLPPGLGGMTRADQGKLFLAEFSDIFPRAVEFSREETTEYFSALGFVNLTENYNLDDCIEIYYKDSQTTNQFVLTWGNGRGFQINLTKDAQTQYEGQRLIESVVLLDGACSWN